ncbi:hypothetical protein CLV30_12027 [Haloactinopolyspora alba]|uniref:Thioesterase superfamily protein n=1 Tax=Haloactinopolyspora alba TaxID=648780 RepID=A0A2P8DM16_9ACTN|nr:hypothetical protein [Haloactinopolyspora alba]PSK98241.1 hypothetical protein CLV30_12027 [Haloactinopolyspora alba]
MTLTVGTRFRGPADSGNGGYVAGLLADGLGTGPVTVTLRHPPPLETSLETTRDDGGVRLHDGATLVAEAVAEREDGDLVSVPPVPVDEARAAARTYPGHTKHPFPECFVCGTTRAHGDGMRLFPGRLGDGRTACVWDVEPTEARAREFVWAALDCPGGWAAPLEGRPMVLGRLTAQVLDTAAAAEACVAMGDYQGTEGRKTWTTSSVYGADGRLLGRARATWIALPQPPR